MRIEELREKMLDKQEELFGPEGSDKSQKLFTEFVDLFDLESRKEVSVALWFMEYGYLMAKVNK
jgi:hypothetical protein